MSTRFKILWIEDCSDWLDIYKLIIEEMLKEYNIVLEIDVGDGTNLDLDEIKNNNYDLILMDYTLNENESGINLIKDIRNRNVTSTILSYSSDYYKMFESISDDDFLWLTFSAKGIYFMKRGEFLENAEKLILDCVQRRARLRMTRE